MKVEWRNFRLTFQAETPQEDEALMAVWRAFGSQIDDRPGVDGEWPSNHRGESVDSVSAKDMLSLNYGHAVTGTEVPL